ncbi:MAG: M48 family metalloprotease [Verrucomicrobiota bacterium]
MSSTLNREERQRWAEIEAAIPAYSIGPDSPSLAYRLGLVGVVVGLLLIIVAYAGLILGILGFAVYEGFHPPVESKSILPWLRYGVILSFSPLVLFFLLKPLFVRRAGAEGLVELEKGEHPLLDAFVERVARYADVPEPKTVYVDCSANASVSYDRGFRGMVDREYRLLIGLSLVSGLDLRSFGGVLAHELGHFAQHHGMRLTYLIRRLNHWLYLIVHERDEWDRELANLALRKRGLRTVLAWPAWALVAIIRGIFWLVMASAHGLSCFALRQMEYGADRYEIAFSGHDGFWWTTKRISQLGAGYLEACRLIRDSWRERMLADDFSLLARSQADRLSSEAVAMAQQLVQKEQGVIFFTHPSDKSRLQKAGRKGWAEGISLDDQPATGLFRDFSRLSRRATRAFYRGEFGEVWEDGALVGNPAIVKDGRRRRREQAAVEGFLGGLWRILPRVHVSHSDLLDGIKGRTREEIDQRWETERELSKERIDELNEARGRYRRAVCEYEAVMAGRKPESNGARWQGDPWKLHERVHAREKEHEKKVFEMRHFVRSTRERLVVDLQRTARRETFVSREVERLVTAMEFFASIEAEWQQLEMILAAQETLVEMLGGLRIRDEVLARLKFRSVNADRLRKRIIDVASGVRNPLHRRGRREEGTMADLINLERGTAEDSGLRSYELTFGVNESLWMIYERVLGRLILLSSIV